MADSCSATLEPMNALWRKIRFLSPLLTLSALLLGCSPSYDPKKAGPDEESNPLPLVVVITLDGVRPEEAFGPMASDPSPFDIGQNAPVMPYLTGELSQTGFMLGQPDRGPGLTLANPMGISMPGYQSMFMGRPTLCLRNQCSPPSGENFFERVQSYYDLPPESVSIYASWSALCPALDPSESFDAHCGKDAIDQLWRTTLQPASDAPGVNPPEDTDNTIFEIAMKKLQTPSFQILFLAFDRTDSTGHARDYVGHIETLRKFDEWIRAIDLELRKLEENGQPSILLVTTDHGRGQGEEWSEHRWNVPGTENLWLFVRGPEGVEAKLETSDDRLTIATVRPTLETLLNVPTRTGWPYERSAVRVESDSDQTAPPTD